MKKTILSVIMLLNAFIIFSQEAQEIKLKVSELKGMVDIKAGEGKWTLPAVGDIITADTEIITGFHSQITLQADEYLYITINQLSEANVAEVRTGKIENAKSRKEVNREEVFVKINLHRGYAVCFSKKAEKIIYRSEIEFQSGLAEFSNAGGEIYSRFDKGALIKAFSGKILINAKLNKKYFLKKTELCLITPSGMLLDNDYFLRREINAKPSSITNEPDIIAYYNYITLPYTENNNLNDYSNQFRP